MSAAKSDAAPPGVHRNRIAGTMPQDTGRHRHGSETVASRDPWRRCGFALLPMIEPHVRGSDCNLGHIRCAGNQQIVEVTDHAKAEKSQRWMMKL
jgi:hypothetical protein